MSYKQNFQMIEEVVKSAHYALNTGLMIYRKPPAGISPENLNLYRSVRSHQIRDIDLSQEYVKGRNCFLVEYAPLDLRKAAKSSVAWSRSRRRTKHRFALLLEYEYCGKPHPINILSSPHTFAYHFTCFTLDTNKVILEARDTDCITKTTTHPSLYEYLVHQVYEFSSSVYLHITSTFDFEIRLRELLRGQNNG